MKRFQVPIVMAVLYWFSLFIIDEGLAISAKQGNYYLASGFALILLIFAVLGIFVTAILIITAWVMEEKSDMQERHPSYFP